MMGPAHSLSGAAAWLGVGAATAAAGHPMPWPVLVVGALICAGAALAPDLDHKSATISRAFGPLSRGLCEVVDKISYSVYKATRAPRDARRTGGHRTLTHTWLWAVLIGAGFLRPRRHRRPLGRARAALRPPGAGRRRPAVAGGPDVQRHPRLAARRDQRLDPRRGARPAGQRRGLALQQPRPGVPVAGPAHPARRPRPRHRRRADRLRLPDPVAPAHRGQALVPDRAAEDDALPRRAAGWS